MVISVFCTANAQYGEAGVIGNEEKINAIAILKGSEKEPDQTSNFDDQHFISRVKERTRKVKTTAEFEPSGVWETPEDFVTRYKTVKGKTINYLKSTNEDLKKQFAAFSPKLGAIDAFQWFLFIAAHHDRHNLQIKKIKANASYPE